MWQLAAAAGAQALGGYLGGQAAKKGAQAAADAQSRALAEARKIAEALQIPDEEALKITLQKPEYADLDLEATLLGASPYQQVQEDALSSDLRRKALFEMQKQYDQGGLTPEMLDAARQISDQQSATTKANIAQIIARDAMEGRSDSGVSSANQLLAAQMGANRAADLGRNLRSEAFREKSNALDRMTREATAQQQYTRSGQERLASDKSDRDRLNAQFLNTSKLNKATFGDRRAENIADISNQQEKYNKQVPLTRYKLEADKANMLMGNTVSQGNVAAALENQKGAGKAQMWNTFGQAAGMGLNAYGQHQMNLERDSIYGERENRLDSVPNKPASQINIQDPRLGRS